MSNEFEFDTRKSQEFMDFLKKELDAEEYLIIILRYGLDTESVPYMPHPFKDLREDGKGLKFHQMAKVFKTDLSKIRRRVKLI